LISIPSANLTPTGYGPESLPKSPGNVTVLSKPFSQPQLVEAVAGLVL
jgi:hypothetical protein